MLDAQCKKLLNFSYICTQERYKHLLEMPGMDCYHYL